MQLTLLDALSAHELINNELADVQGLRHKSELAMHIDDPFDQESARSVLNFCLHGL